MKNIWRKQFFRRSTTSIVSGSKKPLLLELRPQNSNYKILNCSWESSKQELWLKKLPDFFCHHMHVYTRTQIFVFVLPLPTLIYLTCTSLSRCSCMLASWHFPLHLSHLNGNFSFHYYSCGRSAIRNNVTSRSVWPLT